MRWRVERKGLAPVLSDRTLRVLGIPPLAVSLYGNLIRGLTVAVTLPVLVALTVVYTGTVRNTIEIRQGGDFGVFYNSALSVHALGSGQLTVGQSVQRSPNLNPPHFNFVLRPFTSAELPRAWLGWLATSVLALVLSVVVMVRTLALRGWALLATGVFLYVAAPMVATLVTGQVGPMLLLPFTLAWASARRGRPLTAGAWIGLCASIKPFFLLFVPYFLVRRRGAATIATVVPVLALFGIGMAYYGIEAYRSWMVGLGSVTWAEHYLNASVLGFVVRTFSSTEWQQTPVADIPYLVVPVTAVLSLGVGFATLGRVRVISCIDRQFLLIMTAALLLSPLGWVYYFWFLAPPLVATVSSLDRFTWREGGLGFALAGFLVPPFLPLGALDWPHGLGTVTLGSVYWWSLVALWVVALGEPARADVRSRASS